MFAIVGLAVSTTLSLSLLTACDDDDDDPTEEASADSDSNDISTGGNSTEAGEAVDLGLSVKWAGVNVGAAKAADYGAYYAWGETTTKDTYTTSNSATYGDSSVGNISGDATYDAATANWGDAWRTPTKDECQELIDGCTWTWTTQTNSDGEEISGYLVEGNSNSIFLPAVGSAYESSVSGVGTYGYYWTATPNESSSVQAYILSFTSNEKEINQYFDRDNGRPIRPVYSE